MQLRFTMNVTEVRNDEGEAIPTENEHYELAAEQFIEDNKDGVTHEIELIDGTVVAFEMEDIEVIK